MTDNIIENGDQTNDASTMVRDKEIVIHTMPKRFVGAHAGADRAKTIGLAVLAGGFLVLAAALVFVYFYLNSDKGGVPVSVPSASPVASERSAAQPLAGDKSVSPDSLSDTTAEDDMTEPAFATGTAATTTETEELSTGDGPETATGTRVIEAATTTIPSVVKNALDSDNDGLFDPEEILLDCNINAADSDSDGYDDLGELENFYNPAGAGALIVNPNIEKYINPTYGYAVYFPYVWKVSTVGGDDSLMFTLGGNQYIQIVAAANPGRKTLNEWYAGQFGLSDVPEEAEIYKKGWWALMSENGQTVYISRPDSDYIFSLSYQLGPSNIRQFQNLFMLMVRSFEIEN